MLWLKNAVRQKKHKQSVVERRAWVRNSCELDYVCQPLALTNVDRWLGKILDISRSGLSLVMDRRFERGTILVIELQDDAAAVAAPFLARVARCVSRKPDWLIGCTFVRELDDDELQALVSQLK